LAGKKPAFQKSHLFFGNINRVMVKGVGRKFSRCVCVGGQQKKDRKLQKIALFASSREEGRATEKKTEK